MELIKKVIESPKFQDFEKIIKNEKLSHAYLIIGEDYNSNLAFCKAIALKIVCEITKPCFSCFSCKKILADCHPDVLIYPKGKNFMVSDSEEILANINIKPLESKYKILIFNQFDNATIQAQNKLLKTIEEAPQNVIFLINAINSNNILQTIKSRTQIIEILTYTEKNITEDPDYTLLVDLINNLKNTKQILKYAPKFAEKNGFEKRLNTFATLFEMLLQENISGQNKIFVNNDYTTGAIADILNLITKAKKEFLANVNINLITDNLLFKMLEVKYLWNK